MITGRRVKYVSDNAPTSTSRTRLKNRSNLIRRWNRIRGSNIKSDIYSPFIDWAVGFPLLSDRVKSEVGILFLMNQHLRCSAGKPEGLGDGCLFLYVDFTQLQLPYWLKFAWHVPPTPVVLNGRFLLSQSLTLRIFFSDQGGIISANRELNKVPPEGKGVTDISLIAQVGKKEEEGAEGDDDDRGREH